jgi:hypothetical protein
MVVKDIAMVGKGTVLNGNESVTDNGYGSVANRNGMAVNDSEPSRSNSLRVQTQAIPQSLHLCSVLRP